MTLWFTEAPELYRPKRLLQRRPPAAKGRRKRRAKGQAELPEAARHGLAGLRTRHSGFLARPATACSIPLPLRATVAGWWPAWFACRSRQTTLYLAAHPIAVAAAGVPTPWRPSSSGLGRRPFTAKTGVRVPLGAPIKSVVYQKRRLLVSRKCPVERSRSLNGPAHTLAVTTASSEQNDQSGAMVGTSRFRSSGSFSRQERGLLQHRLSCFSPACRVGSRTCGECASQARAAAPERFHVASSMVTFLRTAATSSRAIVRSVSSPSTFTALSLVSSAS